MNEESFPTRVCAWAVVKTYRCQQKAFQGNVGEGKSCRSMLTLVALGVYYNSSQREN